MVEEDTKPNRQRQRQRPR